MKRERKPAKRTVYALTAFAVRLAYDEHGTPCLAIVHRANGSVLSLASVNPRLGTHGRMRNLTSVLGDIQAIGTIQENP